MLAGLKLLRRTLFSRRRGLVRFTAAAAVAGVAIGVASLIVASAVGRGFRDQLRESILSSSPHITVFRDDGGPLADAQGLAASAGEVAGVEDVLPAAFTSGVLIGSTASKYALVRADANADISAGTAELGAELAKSTGLAVGDKADLVTPNGGETRTVRISVTGIAQTGLFETDSKLVRLSAATYAWATGEGVFRPTALEIRVADIYKAGEVAAEIRRVTGQDHRVVDWQEANRPLFAALSLERRAANAVILLIMLVSVLNVTTTLSLLAAERRLDIAVLRTCGARGRALTSMFVLEGAALGVLGAAIGLVLGLAACHIANATGLFTLDPEVYQVGKIVLAPEATDVFLPAAAAIGLCALAAFYPAVAAARVKPMENLRAL